MPAWTLIITALKRNLDVAVEPPNQYTPHLKSRFWLRSLGSGPKGLGFPWESKPGDVGAADPRTNLSLGSCGPPAPTGSRSCLIWPLSLSAQHHAWLVVGFWEEREKEGNEERGDNYKLSMGWIDSATLKPRQAQGKQMCSVFTKTLCPCSRLASTGGRRHWQDYFHHKPLTRSLGHVRCTAFL
jgi:hypothetical protein